MGKKYAIRYFEVGETYQEFSHRDFFGVFSLNFNHG
jgi:hypothetical protein